MKSFTINIPFNQSIHNQLVSLYGVYASLTQKGKYTLPVFHFETAYKIVYSQFPALSKSLLGSSSYKPVREYYKLLLSNAANSARITSNFDFQYSDNITPLPYQKSGVEEILERFKQEQKGCILSDEPGSGKSAQAIWAFYAIQDYINKNRNIYKTNAIDNEKLTQKSLTTALVVCPASVLSTWQEEWTKCARLRNPNLCILGANSQPGPGPEIFITNYDSLWTNRKWLYAQNFDYIVLDEAHNFATGTSKRGRVMKELASKSQFTLLLSGTPIRNYVWQLRYLLNLIDPDSIWNNSIDYETTFCDRKQGKYGIDKTGYSNLRLLKRILKMHYLIRRKKSDVLKQLPKKTVIFEPIDI